MHLDPALPLDIACFTIIAAGINLTVGTLARYLDERPDLGPLVSSMLRLETVGLYLLSERGHGLDAANLETTAYMTHDGFVLNTPREEATK
jgi:acyl-CoA oxidase